MLLSCLSPFHLSTTGGAGGGHCRADTTVCSLLVAVTRSGQASKIFARKIGDKAPLRLGTTRKKKFICTRNNRVYVAVNSRASYAIRATHFGEVDLTIESFIVDSPGTWGRKVNNGMAGRRHWFSNQGTKGQLCRPRIVASPFRKRNDAPLTRRSSSSGSAREGRS